MDTQVGDGGSTRTSKFTSCVCLLASIISLSLGYQIGVISGAVLYIKKDLDLSDEEEEVLVSILSFVSIPACALAGPICDKIGRRLTMFMTATIFIVGSVTVALAPNFLVILIGRMIVGLGFGCGLVVPTLYTAEISPTNSRGILTCIPEIALNSGIMLGYISNYALSGLSVHLNWRLMSGIGIVPPLVMLSMGPVMPETPQWLTMSNRKEEAMAVLVKTLGGSTVLASSRLEEIQEGVDYANEKAGGESQPGAWRQILRPNPVVRRMLIIGLGVQFFQQATGIAAVTFYSPTLFKTAGINSDSAELAATIAVGFSKAAFGVVALVLIESSGRRMLLLISQLGMVLSFVVLATTLLFVDSDSTGAVGVIAVLAACSAMTMFSIGLGPVCWLICNEIYPLKIRSKASSAGAVLNRILNGMVSLTFLSISNAMSVPATLYGYAVVGAIGCVFFYYAVPETKGMSMEEIVSYFHGDAATSNGVEDPASQPLMSNKMRSVSH